MIFKQYGNKINSLFIKGYSFEKGDFEEEKIKKIEKDENLIDIKRENIYKCVNTKDKDYKNLRDEELRCNGEMKKRDSKLVCDMCRREVNIGLKNIEEKRRTIGAVNYIELNKVIKRNLDAIKKDNDNIRSVKKVREKSTWKVIYNNVTLKVKLLDNIDRLFNFGELSFLEEGLVFIAFSSKYLNNLPDSGIINGVNLINNNFDLLKETIESKAFEVEEKELKDEKKKIKELYKLIEENIDGKKDRQFFEKDFSNLFIESLKENSGKLKTFFNFLNNNKGNLKGSMLINLGGASNTDIKIKSKYKYYKILLESNMNWDPKCYMVTDISTDTINPVWRHLSTSWDINGCVIFALSNNISADAWVETEKINRDNSDQIRIVTKDIIFEFIYYMNVTEKFINLIKNHLEER